jgi:hypothetical protein
MRPVITATGFTGRYAALSSARLRDIKGVSPNELEIALVALAPTLVVRPHLYEATPETLTAPVPELLGSRTSPYHQKAFTTCLNLGAAGATLTRGWDRKLQLVSAEGKKTKREINTVSVYPCAAERAAALASAGAEDVTKRQEPVE